MLPRDQLLFIDENFRDGGYRTGVFLAISITLDRYKVTHEIDAYKTVQQLRSIRPQFMENIVSRLHLPCFFLFLINSNLLCIYAYIVYMYIYSIKYMYFVNAVILFFLLILLYFHYSLSLRHSFCATE